MTSEMPRPAEAAVEADAVGTEGTLAQAACCDVALEPGGEESQPVLSFEERVDILGAAVVRHPLNRELLYEALLFCVQERRESDAEAFIAQLPQFRSSTQNPFHMLTVLVRAGGLARVERDEKGREITLDDKAGLPEDEADDLVWDVGYQTTDVGLAFLEAYSPRARLIQALNLAPERTQDYCEVLEFVAAAPRTYREITELLAGRPTLETVIGGRRETMQPSVFVDKLERAGALVWKEGWCLSEAGAAFLEEMKATE